MVVERQHAHLHARVGRDEHVRLLAGGDETVRGRQHEHVAGDRPGTDQTQQGRVVVGGQPGQLTQG